jgi:hypothetical protein
MSATMPMTAPMMDAPNIMDCVVPTGAMSHTVSTHTPAPNILLNGRTHDSSNAVSDTDE